MNASTAHLGKRLTSIPTGHPDVLLAATRARFPTGHLSVFPTGHLSVPQPDIQMSTPPWVSPKETPHARTRARKGASRRREKQKALPGIEKPTG